MTSSLVELLVAVKNKVTDRQASKETSKVTSSLLELLVLAKKSELSDGGGVMPNCPRLFSLAEA